MKIEWAEPAEQDLDSIYAYVGRDVPIYAEQLVDRIIDAVELLYDQPLMGRLVPEAKRNDVRELIFQNYRIMYLVKTDHIYVVAVIHGSRDLTNKTNNPFEIE